MIEICNHKSIHLFKKRILNEVNIHFICLFGDQKPFYMLQNLKTRGFSNSTPFQFGKFIISLTSSFIYICRRIVIKNVYVIPRLSLWGAFYM